LVTRISSTQVNVQKAVVIEVGEIGAHGEGYFVSTYAGSYICESSVAIVVIKAGFTINSGSEQSQGGASIWKALRNDKKLEKDIALRHQGTDDIVVERPAKGISDEDIYVSDREGVMKKDKVKGRQFHASSHEERQKVINVSDSILVLHAKNSKSRLDPGQTKFKPGSIWTTKNGAYIGAKNRDGVIRYFANRPKAARDFAKT
jgi:hypothetical protein